MDSVLIVSGTDKGRDMLAELCRSGEYERVLSAASGSEARRMLLEDEFDLVLINAPLPDEFGHELALSAAESTAAGVMLIAKSDVADEVSARVEDFGVFVLPKPVSRALFFQSVKMMAASRKRMLGLKQETLRLQEKIEEIRLVDRAKCALIQYLNMTEPQAHRYIEKQAMDRRLPRWAVAESILSAYES